MDDLIVFFGEAFSKVLGQDGGSRTEVVRDGGSAPRQERRSRVMEAPLLGRNELPQRSRGDGRTGRRSHRRVAELATQASLPPSSPSLPLHRSAAPVVEPLHRGAAVDRLPRLLAAFVKLELLHFLCVIRATGESVL
jgi:hypothetical protein